MTATAFVFPGQGSQSVGMLDAYASEFSVVRETLAEAADVLGGFLPDLIANGPIEDLNLTVNTQPAMLIADVAIYRAWLADGGKTPDVVAGHSLGEYAALVAANAIPFSDALKLVRLRAELMQEAVPAGQGGMAAVIGMDDEAVIRLCAEQAQGEILEAVNFNAPGQVVVAGAAAAIGRLLENAKAAGARMVTSIPVSVPAHSSLLAGAATQLRDALDAVSWQAPTIPVIHNVDAAVHADATDIPELLEKQLHNPVRWVQTLQSMESQFGVVSGLECGPGSVLCGLAKRTIKSVPFASLSNVAVLKEKTCSI